MSFTVKRSDESGLWSQGPFSTVSDAQAVVSEIIKTRKELGEKYTKATPSHGERVAYVSNKGGTIVIKEI